MATNDNENELDAQLREALVYACLACDRWLESLCSRLSAKPSAQQRTLTGFKSNE